MCGLIERISTKLNKDEKMDIKFNEDVVKLNDDGVVVSSVLLRAGRDTPILSMPSQGLNEVSKIKLEEKVFACFSEKVLRGTTNANLFVKWENDYDYLNLKVELKPLKDIQAGCLIKVNEILFW